MRQIRSMNYFIILESFTFLTNFLKVKKLQKYISTFFCSYLGSWRHLSVKIFRSRCIVKTFRDQTYIYMEAIYQISAQSETWIDTVSEGEVLAPFT